MKQITSIKYTYGTPIETDAVVDKGIQQGKELIRLVEEKGCFTYTLKPETVVYGLGENLRGINKRGWIYESFCADDCVHTEAKRSLYGAHNFFIVAEDKPFGVFVDYPGRISFDIGYSNIDELIIKPETMDFNLYIIEGETPLEIVKAFRQMIGTSYIPPKWAFGYQQSRWSYKTSEEVRQVAKNFKDNGIPIDTIYLDIDYMERFKDFTVDETAFPNFEAFVQEMKEMGIRLIPIIDAGVKVEEGYETYEEGLKENCFVTDGEGNVFEGAVWPGKVHFPDFLNSKTRRWFGHKYAFLLDKGIEGFWNDMNEPAIFYTPKAVEAAMANVEKHRGENIDLGTFFGIKDSFSNIMNQEAYYKDMYHDMDGVRVCHYDVHNLYGYNMTRAAGEAFKELRPNTRTLLFSRASYIGMHRYGGIWTGDNCSWWSHLLLNIKMMPSLNMCGFMYAGADVGGFSDNTTEELLTRWLQFGVFTPLLRNHTAAYTRFQEPYNFKYTERIKKWIEMRYALVPYLYSEYMKATLSNDMLFKPLAFEYNDPHCTQVEDQLLVGESIMIAPVYEQNKTGRYVYLPENMLYVNFESATNYTVEEMKKGHHYIEADLDHLPVFIRPNHMLILGEVAANVEAQDSSKLHAIGYYKDHCAYKLYEDDGITPKPKLEDSITEIYMSDINMKPEKLEKIEVYKISSCE